MFFSALGFLAARPPLSLLMAHSWTDGASGGAGPAPIRAAVRGTDLRMVEQVYGRLNWGRAALGGVGGGLSQHRGSAGAMWCG